MNQNKLLLQISRLLANSAPDEAELALRLSKIIPSSHDVVLYRGIYEALRQLLKISSENSNEVLSTIYDFLRWLTAFFPNEADFWFDLAMFSQQTGNKKISEEALLRSLDLLNEDFATVRAVVFTSGILQLKMNKIEEARFTFQKLAELFPDSIGSKIGDGLLALIEGKQELFHEILDELHQSSPLFAKWLASQASETEFNVAELKELAENEDLLFSSVSSKSKEKCNCEEKNLADDKLISNR